MLQGEHSAILLTFSKVPFVINILVLSIFEWPLKTGFTVVSYSYISLARLHHSLSVSFQKIQHVLHVLIGKEIFEAWHNHTLEARRQREYFEVGYTRRCTNNICFLFTQILSVF